MPAAVTSPSRSHSPTLASSQRVPLQRSFMTCKEANPKSSSTSLSCSALPAHSPLGCFLDILSPLVSMTQLSQSFYPFFVRGQRVSDISTPDLLSRFKTCLCNFCIGHFHVDIPLFPQRKKSPTKLITSFSKLVPLSPSFSIPSKSFAVLSII